MPVECGTIVTGNINDLVFWLVGTVQIPPQQRLEQLAVIGDAQVEQLVDDDLGAFPRRLCQ